MRYFALRQKNKNMIGNKLIFGRFGLPYLRQAGLPTAGRPTYGRQAYLRQAGLPTAGRPA